LPPAAVTVVETTDRAALGALLKLDSLIDLVIPRGGEGLIRMVAENSRIPTIKHFKGVCHVYVDDPADLNLAQVILMNSKLQRVATCNTAETLLVHARAAQQFLPTVAKALIEKNCDLRVCPRTRAILNENGVSSPQIKDADEQTFYTEYLDRILSVRIVDSLEEAADHIEKYGSRHTESIVTSDPERGRRFQNLVDSACVFVNASTRLCDGFEFGLGAEIGISTDKLHARGPMGAGGTDHVQMAGRRDGAVADLKNFSRKGLARPVAATKKLMFPLSVLRALRGKKGIPFSPRRTQRALRGDGKGCWNF